MTHAYHKGLPGYHPDQVLHDGCGECESRAASRNLGLANLDSSSFARAWYRAARYNRAGLNYLSDAERPMLDALWAVQVQLERRGIEIGVPPGDLITWTRGLPL